MQFSCDRVAEDCRYTAKFLIPLLCPHNANFPAPYRLKYFHDDCVVLASQGRDEQTPVLGDFNKLGHSLCRVLSCSASKSYWICKRMERWTTEGSPGGYCVGDIWHLHGRIFGRAYPLAPLCSVCMHHGCCRVPVHRPLSHRC